MYYLLTIYIIIIIAAIYTYCINHPIKKDSGQQQFTPDEDEDCEGGDDEEYYDSDEYIDEDDADYDEYQEGSERETDYCYYYNQDSEE